jgi:hypothetical protein
MRSGDAELDMRGRCSAGQKVQVSVPFQVLFCDLTIRVSFYFLQCF